MFDVIVAATSRIQNQPAQPKANLNQTAAVVATELAVLVLSRRNISIQSPNRIPMNLLFLWCPTIGEDPEPLPPNLKTA